MWRLEIPALSNTPESRSNNAFLPPNASLARAFASCCSTTCVGTAVASESKLQGRMWGLSECVTANPWFTVSGMEQF